tara:strand:- start:591 stop:791 length:201 start_codon:yes stop_codon:yes gene_type:complete
MSKHAIYRNGRLYDSLDPETHAVKQIAASWARDMVGDQFEVRDENGEWYYRYKMVTSCGLKIEEEK